MAARKSLHEEFTRFFESPTRDKFRDLLKTNLGEFPHCDFKREWPDLKGLTKHVLGMANCGGGCVVAGVEQQEDKSLNPVGLPVLTDKSDISKVFDNFLPQVLFKAIDILDFSYHDSDYPTLKGKQFQIVVVPGENKYLPYLPTRETEGLRGTGIYVRRGASTVEANYEELQDLLNRRIETNYSTKVEGSVQDHLQQLKALFREISPTIVTTRNPFSAWLLNFNDFLSTNDIRDNPRYPTEDYEAFVIRLITEKKELVRKLLGLA